MNQIHTTLPPLIVEPGCTAGASEAVRGFVAAINQAIQDAVANPEEAIDALMRREPLLKCAG